MDILRIATEWAKAEVFSSSFFILFGIIFLLASAGFWQLGKTDIAKAYVIPTSVAGVLILIIGLGLVYTNKTRITDFEVAYSTDAPAFVEAEIDRAKKTLKEYKTVVFTAIPIIIAVCALVLVFANIPMWRASMITTIAMMVTLLLVDGTAHARIDAYYQQLMTYKEADRGTH